MKLAVVGASAPAHASGTVPPDYLTAVLVLAGIALILGFLLSTLLLRRSRLLPRLLLTLPMAIAAFLAIGWVVTGGGETLLRLLGR